MEAGWRQNPEDLDFRIQRRGDSCGGLLGSDAILLPSSLYPEGRGSMELRNVRILPQQYTAPHRSENLGTHVMCSNI
jgi:hypothetical protein